MSWKGRISEEFNVDGLEAVLLNSKTATDNNPLWQVCKGLITATKQLKKFVDSKLGKTDKISLTEQVDGVLPYQNGGVLTGIYIPILTIIANIDTAGFYYTPWVRVGNLITVSGKVTIDPTAAATLTQLELSLPVASLFAHTEQCSGVANGVPFAGSTVNFAGIVSCNPITGNALIEFYSTNAVNNDVRFTFTYQFIPK